MIAVDISDGTVRWRINLYDRVAETVPDRFLTAQGRSSDQFSPLALATPETVYVQSSYGLHGLAPADGHEQWRLYLGDRSEDARVLADPGGLALIEDRVWASYGRPTPSVYSIEMIDDTPTVERATAPSDLPGRPVVTDDGAVAMTTQVVWSTDAHRTLAFGIAGGRGVTWQFPGLASSGAAAFSSIATDGKRVFVCEGHESTELFVVFALRAATGGLEWIHRESLAHRDISTASPAEFRLCQPVIAEDTLLTGYGTSPENERGQGALVALSPSDGSVRWQTDLSLAPGDMAIASDQVYISGQQKGVVAFEADESG